MTAGTSARLAVFRCAASPEIGMGHLRRCQALAAALEPAGWRCEFATGGETPDDLRARWPQGAALLVIDGYGFDADFGRACRGWAAKIAVIDDLADRPYEADLLIDHNIGRTAPDYDGLVPKGCTVLAGPGYALLARAHAACREASVPRGDGPASPPRILVSLGGGDAPVQRTLLGRVLDGLGALTPAPRVAVVAPSAERAIEIAERGVEARTGVPMEEIARLAADSDLGVGAGGVSLLERCCVGLPGLVVTVADNQRRGTEAAAAAGACRDLGTAEEVTADIVARAAARLLGDGEAWSAMTRAAASLTDGAGAARVAAALGAGVSERTGTPVILRRATADDAALMLEWQRHPATRRYARNPAVPTEDEHAAWLRDRLARGDCLLNVVMCGDVPAGALRLDRIAETPDCGRTGYEVSILTAPQLQGRGVARAALALARYLAGAAPIWAQVDRNNAASNALFRHAGYRATGDGWYVAAREAVPA